MSTWKQDETAWYQAWLDTVLSPSAKAMQTARRPEDVRWIPGICVKSAQHDAKGWPVHYGILVSADRAADLVTVRTHNETMHEPHAVWTGTCIEYQDAWQVD